MEVIIALKFKTTSFAAPTCFEFIDEENNKYHFRYRHGKYTFTKYENDKPKIEYIGNYGDKYDGYITASDFIKLMWERHNIGIIIKSTFNEDANVEAQITLYERMKSYENFDKLNKKEPVILRLDGVAFHTFTKGLNKPFDGTLSNLFMLTCEDLIKNIQNARFIYCQSDEISILLNSYEKEETQPWLDYRIEKLCSIATSLTTNSFNKYIRHIIDIFNSIDRPDFIDKWQNKLFKANFDCRCFNLPLYEVSNYFIYRQMDCIRNSKSKFAQAYFSQKQLNNVNSDQAIEMVKTKFNIDWNETQLVQQRGFCIYKRDNDIITDISIPLFGENREYINKFVF